MFRKAKEGEGQGQGEEGGGEDVGMGESVQERLDSEGGSKGGEIKDEL